MPRRGDLIKATKVNGGATKTPWFCLYYGQYSSGKHTGWASTTLNLRILRKKLGKGVRLDKFRILVPVEFM
jgi:hypothetical protein